MIADKYINFFLDGNFGKNPVALEIPIDRTHPELVPFFTRTWVKYCWCCCGGRPNYGVRGQHSDTCGEPRKHENFVQDNRITGQ